MSYHHDRAQRESVVGAGQLVHIIDLAARSGSPVKLPSIPGGDSMLNFTALPLFDLCLRNGFLLPYFLFFRGRSSSINHDMSGSTGGYGKEEGWQKDFP